VLRRDDVSRTARLVAACRALDARLPDGERMIARRDEHAAGLAGDEAMAHAASLPALVSGIALRTRWLDDRIEAFAGTQVVLVGAGLDTRAHRLARRGVRFFEVDLPGMLEYKPRVTRGARRRELRRRRSASRARGRGPRRASGVGGADPDLRGLEGVSYYLPAEAVAAALEDFRGLIEPDGVLLFDFVLSRWLTAAHRASPEVVAQVARWGEPMIHGFSDARADLAAHGLELVEDVGVEELLPRYGRPAASERWYAGRMAAARAA
jgi:methyltransferase (TIGR00027 family)